MLQTLKSWFLTVLRAGAALFWKKRVRLTQILDIKITYLDSNLFDSEFMRRAAFNRFLEQSGFSRLRVRSQCIVK